MTDHDQKNKSIATQEFNKLTAKILKKIKKGWFAQKTDFNNKLINFKRKEIDYLK